MRERSREIQIGGLNLLQIGVSERGHFDDGVTDAGCRQEARANLIG